MKGFLLLILLALGSVSSQGFEVVLAWDANSEADLAGYRIYYGVQGATNAPVVAESAVSGSPLVTISGLVLGETYEFYATAFNTAGLESEPSEVLTFTVPTRPSAPKGLRIVVTVDVALPEN